MKTKRRWITASGMMGPLAQGDDGDGRGDDDVAVFVADDGGDDTRPGLAE